MTIILDPETENYLREAARREGLDDVGVLIKRLVAARRAAEQQGTLTRGQRAVQRLRDAKTNGIGSDELMALTRDRS